MEFGLERLSAAPDAGTLREKERLSEREDAGDGVAGADEPAGMDSAEFGGTERDDWENGTEREDFDGIRETPGKSSTNNDGDDFDGAERDALQQLTLPPRLQDRHEVRLEPDRPTPAGLGRRRPVDRTLDHRDGPADRHLSPTQVDVAPCESEHLASSATGEGEEREWRLVPTARFEVEEPRHLCRRPRSHLGLLCRSHRRRRCRPRRRPRHHLRLPRPPRLSPRPRPRRRRHPTILTLPNRAVAGTNIWLSGPVMSRGGRCCDRGCHAPDRSGHRSGRGGDGGCQ